MGSVACKETRHTRGAFVRPFNEAECTLQCTRSTLHGACYHAARHSILGKRVNDRVGVEATPFKRAMWGSSYMRFMEERRHIPGEREGDRVDG